MVTEHPSDHRLLVSSWTLNKPWFMSRVLAFGYWLVRDLAHIYHLLLVLTAERRAANFIGGEVGKLGSKLAFPRTETRHIRPFLL